MSTEIIEVADLTPELLTALKSAQPEQVGDDLVLRLPDGRVYYIDGFFAVDEKGDGLPPVEGALPLSPEIAALLLGESGIDTAAGSNEDEPPIPPDSAADFSQFAPLGFADASGSSGGTGGLGGSGGPGEGGAFSIAAGPGDGDLNSADRARTLYGSSDGGSGGSENPGGGSTSPFAQFGSGYLGGSGFGGVSGPPSAGNISISGGGLSSPGFFFPGNLEQFVPLATPDNPGLLLHSAGWLEGIARLTTASGPLPIDAMSDPNAYDWYLKVFDQLKQYAPEDSIWMALPTLSGNHRNDIANGLYEDERAPVPPIDKPLADWFLGNDFIIAGGGAGKTLAKGYGGNDTIIGYGSWDAGSLELYGDGGDDHFHLPCGARAEVVDGGAGTDTLTLWVTDAVGPVYLGAYRNSVASIERVEIKAAMLDSTPQFLYTMGQGATERGGYIAVYVDADTVRAFGGNLTIDVADKVRFSDLGAWTRLPADPADPGHVHYTATIDGKAASLAVADWISQPIEGHLVGTSEPDYFDINDRYFTSYDGGNGMDSVGGGGNQKNSVPFGERDYSDASTQPFSNIEIFQVNTGDHLILSAAAIAAMTDANNSLTVTKYYQTILDPAAGKVTLTDGADWTAAGFFTLFNDAVAETGALYRATSGGEAVQLFVSAGIDLPVVENDAMLSNWFLNFDGTADLLSVRYPDTGGFPFGNLPQYGGIIASDYLFEFLPDPEFYGLTTKGISGLDIIDLGGGTATQFCLSAASAVEIAGNDHSVAIVGDKDIDGVTFRDEDNWHLAGVERDPGAPTAFYVYEGADADGNSVTLRISSDLLEPALTPHATSLGDVLKMTDVVAVDGMGGFDIVQILNDGAIDLSGPASGGLRHVEAIDLGNGAVNSLSLSAESVAAIADGQTLYVAGDHAGSVTDSVSLTDALGWQRGADSFGFAVYTSHAMVGGVDTLVTLAVQGDLVQPAVP